MVSKRERLTTLTYTTDITFHKDEIEYIDFGKTLASIKDHTFFCSHYTNFQLKDVKIRVHPLVPDDQQPIIYALAIAPPGELMCITDFKRAPLKLYKKTDEDLVFTYDIYCSRVPVADTVDTKSQLYLGGYHGPFNCILHIEFGVIYS